MHLIVKKQMHLLHASPQVYAEACVISLSWYSIELCYEKQDRNINFSNVKPYGLIFKKLWSLFFCEKYTKVNFAALFGNPGITDIVQAQLYCFIHSTLQIWSCSRIMTTLVGVNIIKIQHLEKFKLFHYVQRYILVQLQSQFVI